MSVFDCWHQRLQHAIVNHLQWKSLREIQELASPPILAGNNVLLIAPTAEGKTEAALFPLISQLLDLNTDGVKCVYISPLTALLNNIEKRLQVYTHMVGLSCFKWHGGIKPGAKRSFVKEPADILMITPESLEVMLISAKVPDHKLFSNLAFVVVDEIHALADCDRGGHLISLLARLHSITGRDFQRIGLSATVGAPEQVLEWLQSTSQRERYVVNIAKSTKKRIEIKYLSESDIAKVTTPRLLNNKSLFFCDSRAQTEIIAKSIENCGVQVFVHHSSISQEKRKIAEEAMIQAPDLCIVCTSTLQLGIDVGELDKIFQINCPTTVSAFLQRMGRTGRRAGSKMNTTFLTTSYEAMLQAIALVELARNHWVENIRLNDRCWHLLVQQIMALCLQYGAIPRYKIWDTVSNASCFKAINKREFYSLIEHMLQHDFVTEESGVLSMGIKAEKVFGRKNFLELYAVFSSFEEYQVKSAGGENLGCIEQRFADVLTVDSCFRLAGSSWTVTRIEQKTRTIWVVKAPAGKIPSWSSFAPKLLSYQICRKIYDILTSDELYPYCDKNVKTQLTQIRLDKQFLRESFAPLERENGHVIWWTYAGGRINNTLKYTISYLSGCEAIANNYFLRLSNPDRAESLSSLIKQMNRTNFWSNLQLKGYLLNVQPDHRLSKFQFCLPKDYQCELLANEFLDVPGTKNFLLKYSQNNTGTQGNP